MDASVLKSFLGKSQGGKPSGQEVKFSVKGVGTAEGSLISCPDPASSGATRNAAVG